MTWLQPHLADAGDAKAIVADGTDDAGHVSAVAVAVPGQWRRRIRVEVGAKDVIHYACWRNTFTSKRLEIQVRQHVQLSACNH